MSRIPGAQSLQRFGPTAPSHFKKNPIKRLSGMIGAIALLTCAISIAKAQVIYNFSGAHTGHNAYEGAIPSSPLPPASKTIPVTELGSTDYGEIASSNDDTDSTNNTSSSNRAAQRYVFTLAQSGASLFDMDVLWEGHTSSGGTVRFYIWNNNTSSYTLVGSTTNSSADVNLTAVYASPSQYIDASNKVTLLALNTADTESTRTDYVRIIVRQCATNAHCNDNNACTTDTCNSGLCVFSNNTNTCNDDGNTCTNDICASGACTHPTKANGSACSDGNACTQNDVCQSGACTGSNPVICTAQDSCHNAGTCAPATGICSNPAKPDGATCSDGNACTQTDVCQSGTCNGTNPVVCTALDACHDVGACAPETGICSNPEKPDGTTCSDGLFCNGAEACTDGTCQAPSAPNCEDGVSCTTDACNESNDSCDHTPIDAACSDGLNCNGPETCHMALGCQLGEPINCDDGVACTIDACNEMGGAFVSTAVSHVNGATHVISTSNPVSGDFTAMLWVRIDIDRGAPSTFFFIGGSIAEPRYFKSLYAGTGGDPAGRTTWIQALTPGTPIDPGNSDVLELGEWHHIAMVGNASGGGAIKLYLDGVLRQSGNAPAGTYVGEFIEVLNVPLNEGNDRMIGSFSAWKRFDVQLTQAQILAEMPFSRAVNRTQLVQEVTFLNNTDILDQSGHGNHFVVTGPALEDAAVGPNIQVENSQTCEHTPSNAACDDGLYCNGVETCHEALGCQPGTPPNCDDGVTCTDDSCNEAGDSCEHVPDNGDCDDGLFCNGSESCHQTLGCQPGISPNCADDVTCTDDNCENNACVHIPNDGNCADDGLFCSGAEVCHPIDGCLSVGDPCPVGQHCNEGTETCGECSIDAHCDDGVGCTDDTCELGGCVYTTNNAHCPDDSIFCNGSEYCDLMLDCRSTGNPCSAEFVCRESDDSCVACLVDADCDEGTPFCVLAPGICVQCMTDADCDEGEPCIVGHTCVEGACQAGVLVECSGFNSECMTASCDPAGPEGNCDMESPVANGAECSDGNECTNGDSCMDGACQAGTPTQCAPPDQCHAAGTCNPETGSCSYAPLENGTPCNDGNACTRDDVCANGACLAGTSMECVPVAECQVGQCNPQSGVCGFSPVQNGTTCDDGSDCTIDDSCHEGTCQGAEVYALSQWSELSNCLTGPGTEVAEGCDCSNLAPDELIDLSDIAEFMVRFSGQ